MRGRDDQSILDALMGSFGVIVLEVLLDKIVQVLIAEADEVIQTFVLD